MEDLRAEIILAAAIFVLALIGAFTYLIRTTIALFQERREAQRDHEEALRQLHTEMRDERKAQNEDMRQLRIELEAAYRENKDDNRAHLDALAAWTTQRIEIVNELDAVRDQVKKLVAENAALREQVEALDARNQALVTEIGLLKKVVVEIDLLKVQNKELRTQNRKLTETVNELTAQRDDARTERDQERKHREDLEQKMTTLENRVNALNHVQQTPKKVEPKLEVKDEPSKPKSTQPAQPTDKDSG